MKLSDMDRVKPIHSQLMDLRKRYRDVDQARSFQIPMFGIELAEYDPPSVIGATFSAVRAALLQMLEKQIKAQEDALRAIGVDPD